MKWSIYLGKISGIKIFIHWTFFILIAWIVFADLRQGYNFQQIALSVGFILSIFACVVLHELGHALTAKRFNYKTRNIMLLPIGGVANMEGLPEKPKQEFLVAIMGPAVNFVIALLIYAGLQITGTIPAPGAEVSMMVTAENFWFQLMSINIILGVFNLIPAFPMDGGRILRALLAIKLTRQRATRIAATVGQFIAAIFVILGFFYNPFLAFIGLFVFLGARAEANMEDLKAALQDIKVEDVLMRQYSPLSGSEPLSHAVSLLLDGQEEAFIVKNNGEVSGTISKKEIINGLSKYGEEVAIEKVMQKNVLKLRLQDKISEIVLKFSDGSHEIMPVIEGDELLGVINLENINEFVQVQSALGKVKN